MVVFIFFTSFLCEGLGYFPQPCVFSISGVVSNNRVLHLYNFESESREVCDEEVHQFVLFAAENLCFVNQGTADNDGFIHRTEQVEGVESFYRNRSLN